MAPVGVPKREPCKKCGMPVFLAERLSIGDFLYHRTCLRCARCNTQLTPGSFYETELDGEFCCETCPDEERSTPNKSLIADRISMFENPSKSVLERSVSDEEKSKKIWKQQNDDELKKIESTLQDKYSKNTAWNSFMSEQISMKPEQKINVDNALGDTDSDEEPPALPATLPPIDIPVAAQRVSLANKNEIADSNKSNEIETVAKNSAIVNESIENSVVNQSEPESGTEMRLSETITDANIPETIESSVTKETIEINLLNNNDKIIENNSRVLVSNSEISSKISGKLDISNTNEIEIEHVSVTVPLDDEKLELPLECDNIVTEETNIEIVENEKPIEEILKNVENEVPVAVTSSVVEDVANDIKEDVTVNESIIPEKPKTIEAPIEAKPEEIKENGLSYPSDLDPFADNQDEGATDVAEEKKTVNMNTTVSSNPFEGLDDDDEEPETQKIQSKPVNKVSTNPFGSDSEEEEEELYNNVHLSTPKRTPVPTPRKSILATPLSDSKESSLNGSTTDLLRRDDFRGSSKSIVSSCSSSGTPGRPKKGRAPPPPVAQIALSPEKLNNEISSNGSSPRTLRKKRPAPKPPVIQSSINQSNETTVRKLIPLSEPLKSMENDNELNLRHPTDGELTYRRKIMPLSPVRDDSFTIQNMTNYDRQWEKVKDNKEELNRTRQSQLLHTTLHLDEEAGDSIHVDKSTQGKWKRRKGPAPALPIPPRKVIQMLPLQEIRHELEIIEVQQQGLEKQGVQLEKMIRDRCEGPDGKQVHDENEKPSKEVEDLIMQLFDLVNEKNELFRRQAELMYLRRQHRLEQEQADLEYEIRVLMAQPERNKTDSDKAREEKMIARLVEVVELRNDVIDCLEMDRLREAEEDLSIKTQIEIHSAKRDEELNSSLNTMEKLSKKEKKKQKEAKKLAKLMKVDAEKDADESEMTIQEKPEKKKKKKFLILGAKQKSSSS